MDLLLNLFCIPTEQSLDSDTVGSLRFEELIAKTMASSGIMMSDDSLQKNAVSRLSSIISDRSHTPKNTLKMLDQMFDIAVKSCTLDRERNKIMWLKKCVGTLVSVCINDQSKEKVTATTATPAIMTTDTSGGTSNDVKKLSIPKNNHRLSTDHLLTVPPKGSWTSDDDSAHSDALSDDSYSGTKKPNTKKKGQRRSNKPTVDLSMIPVGGGCSPVLKYFKDKERKDKLGPDRLNQSCYAEAYFFPNPDSVQILLTVLATATTSIDLCMFSLTDDDVANTLIAAKQRNVSIRIITDDQNLNQLGADTVRLNKDYGIPYKTDHSFSYMHHKFVIIDKSILINGSYNYSKNARTGNQENIVIMNYSRTITQFQMEFDKLWEKF